MKSAVFVLGLLITLGGLLLGKSSACYTELSWQTVGQIVVPDPNCTTTGAQCRQELAQVAWDANNKTFDWVYVPTSCVPCPAGTAPATCSKGK